MLQASPCVCVQLEYQRQQLLQERQQFHLEQIRAAEYRARQIAMTQLAAEQRQHPPTASPDQGRAERESLGLWVVWVLN